MNRDNPVNRWLLFGVASVLLLPILAFLMFSSQIGLFTLLSSPMSAVSLVFVGCLGGYLLAIWLVLFRGRLFASALVVLLCGYLQVAVGYGMASGDAEHGRIYQLDFKGFPPQKGIEVYCNDVHLGTTPFMLRESEFLANVSPRKTPPTQPRVIYRSSGRDPGPDAWSKWTWMPSDPFADIRGTSSSDRDYHHDKEKLNQKFASAPYWWRFERDGCLGLSRVGQLSSSGGGGRIQTFNVSFRNIFYPSQEPHYERIMEAARAADYQPDQPWLEHFFRYQPFFEDELFRQAKTNPQIDSLIDYIAAARYDIPQPLDERTADKLLHRLLDDAEREDRFTTPSLANRAVLQIGKKFPHLISDAYRHEVTQFPGHFGGGRSRSGEIRTWQGGASWVRQHALLETMIQTSPPEAFDTLIFRAGQSSKATSIDPQLLIAIGNYRRPEAVRFINQWFHDVLGSVSDTHGRFRSNQRVALGVMAEIDNPELQKIIRDRVQRQFPVTGIGSNFELNEYFVVRIARGDDPEILANLIAFCNGLRPKEKAPLLWQLHCSAAGEQLYMLTNELTRYEIQSFANSIRSKPLNPFAGKFLVAAYEQLKQQQPNQSNGLDTMLLQIESDQANEFLRECLENHKDNEWSWMVEKVGGSLPHLDWMVPEIEAFESRDRRRFSCKLLKAIGTESALTLLRDWTVNSDRSLSAAASRALQTPIPLLEKDPIDETLVKEAEELISGRMRPDDLLPPAKSFVWNGSQYEPTVRETTSNSDAVGVVEQPAGVQADSVPSEPVVDELVMPTLEETIATLRNEGKTEEAEYLTMRLAYANKYHESRGWRFIFGRVVVNGAETPQMCQAQLPIHQSGWFLGSFRDPKRPIEFRLFGYRLTQVLVGDRRGVIVNVGDVELEPFRFEELATVRGEVLLEGSVDPAQVEIQVLMQRPKSNSGSGGSSGWSMPTDKQNATLDAEFRFQLTGLAPIEHYVVITAPKHQSLRREFIVEPGGTTDVGVLRVAASPKVEVEYAASSSVDFTDAKRNRVSLYDGERFLTNPASKDSRVGGQLILRQEDGRSRLRSHIHGGVYTDLGEGAFEDFLTPERPDVENIRDRDAYLVDGHVYLFYHHTEDWKHWTLMRVTIASSPDDSPASREDPADADKSDAGVDVPE